MNKYLKNHDIICILSNYKTSIDREEEVINLINKNKVEQSLKMLNLDKEIINKKFKELSLSEQFKIDLLSKLKNNVIVIGNMSTSLLYKDKEMIKKILLKIAKDYDKKIIVIDDDISDLMNFCKCFLVIKEKKVVYETCDLYDDELYRYTKMPEIVSFIKKANKNGANLNNYTSIHELIKAIYRSVA